MQVVLDTLAPAERAAFILHDVFGYPFDEDQRCDRAFKHRRTPACEPRTTQVRGVPEPVAAQAVPAENQRVVDAFLTAARCGDTPSCCCSWRRTP